MSDPITGALITQLGAIIEQQIRENIKLVVNVDKEIEKLKSTLISIQAVILDADNKQVKEHSIRLWLQRLGDVCYDLDDVLAEWSIALYKFQRLENNTPYKKVCSLITFPCFCFQRITGRRDVASKIKDLNKRLDQIDDERRKYGFSNISSSNQGIEKRLPTNSFIEESKVKGRDEEKTILVKELLKEREDRLNIVSVVGMGGIGKTTLAQLAYNSDEVKDHFKMRLWVVVSEPFDLVRIAKAIIENIDGNKDPELFELNTILNRVREKIKGERYLLILDDAWTYDITIWEPLISSLGVGASGSTLLVTTRNEKVAKIIRSKKTIHLDVLSNEDCWDLFSQYAFFDRRNEDLKHLEPIGRDIANKCKGLPLAAKTIGSLMRFKNSVDDWKNVLKSDTWDLEEDNILPPLLLSYYALEEYAWRRCFRYCAIFPKDTVIAAKTLIKLWMANGYLISKGNVDMEAIGREYLDNLAMQCFFQDLKRDGHTNNIVRFKMHDMVHDLAQYLTKNECSTMEVVDGKLPQKELRHLTLLRPREVSFQSILGDTTKLRTFWVQSNGLYIKSGSIKFSHVLHLKVLDISDNNFSEVPNDIEKLLNLRYLNLSLNLLLEELPESVCELYNLQTLKLNWCKRLKRLPQGIDKLEKLRHLEIDGTDDLNKLPKGIGKLRFLQTLSKVVLSSINDDPVTFNLGDLMDLKQLRGSLRIEGLGFVDVPDAKELELHRFQTKLVMDFKPPSLSSQEVAEALELHPDVKKLEMHDYGGAQLPNWIVSLNNLHVLRLMWCENCTVLPPLGKLQSLETLEIVGMHGVKRIGEEFLGIEAYNNSNNGALIDIFPKLKSLVFRDMRSWEEWDITSAAIANGVEDKNLRIMPCLQYLDLVDCIKLKEMPPLGKLQSLETLYIYGMDELKRIGEEFLGIEAYNNSNNGAIINIFPKLKSLVFQDMKSWEEWDITSAAIAKGVEDGNLRIMPCIQKLTLIDCINLKQVPEILRGDHFWNNMESNVM